MRVLVVEDDAKIASFVVKGLKQEGFGIITEIDGVPVGGASKKVLGALHAQ